MVKAKEEPKQTGSAEKGEIKNGETDIRGTSTRDNSKPVGERPDTSRSDTARSVPAPQGERNVGNGTGERGVHGEIEKELTLDVIGDAKLRVQVSDSVDISDDIDNINVNYLNKE